MPSVWAPEEGETSPRKVYWLRNEADAKSSWYTELQQMRVSLFHSPGMGSTQLRILVETSQVTQRPYPPPDIDSHPKEDTGKRMLGKSLSSLSEGRDGRSAL